MKSLIIGAGKLGNKLAESMVTEDIDVTVMDKNSERINRLSEQVDCLTIVANGMDIGCLKELGIETYDYIITCTGSDETNTLICTIAKKLGCKTTIARIRNPEYKEQLDFLKEELGIDIIINPDLATANVIETYLMKSYSFYSGDFADGRIQMLDFNIGVSDEFVGKRLKDLKNFEDMLIAAISRDGEIIIPYGDTELLRWDTIYVIGKADDISNLGNILKDNEQRQKVERVMIMGGSNIAVYLSSSLQRLGVAVTIVELEKKRCQELTKVLDGVLIINGDGTDIHLLEEENLDKMDAFIGLTGFDEQNVLMALLAKHMGVPKVVGKVSRPNYNKIIDKLGIDAAFNPIHVTVSDILKVVRGGKVVSVSLLIGGDGEVTELVVGKGTSIVNKPLNDLQLPYGIIIGAIVHDDEVIIPNGETVIYEGDRIIVFCLTDDLPTLRSLIRPSKGNMLKDILHLNRN